MLPTLLAISVLSFIIIQLPPGDFLTAYMAQLVAQVELVNQELKLGLPEDDDFDTVGGFVLAKLLKRLGGGD